MRRDDAIDFFVIEDHQIAMHLRLENWARSVEVWWGRGAQHPMWLKSRSNSRQWHAPDLRPPTDTQDGMKLEKAVAQLPEKHRDALRWNYVYRSGPLHAARKLGVSKAGLFDLVRVARQMLINRRV